ncbi:MAG TPA: aldose 1-epimerase family protein [Streptosporangiaceae bacterium]|jgi:aldose 1-epimerase
MPQTLPLTGAQYEIAAGDYQATITELGAGLRTLTHRGYAVVTGYPADERPPAGAGQLLAPWPNRVDRGRYSFGGANHQLDLSEPARGNAIHGLTRWASWQLADHTADQVELRLDLLGQPGYPFRLELRASYRLAADSGLEVIVTASNSGSRPAPFGTGSHPYLRAAAAGIEDCELQLPAARWQPADDRGIPAGAPQDVTGSPFDFRSPRPVQGITLDHGFTDLQADSDGRAWVRLTGPDAQLALWAGPGYRWLQAFTADTLAPPTRRGAVAIEPMTCPPNAFVTGTDLLTLAPGQRSAHHWGLQATAISY